MAILFRPEDRDAVRDRLVNRARADGRIVAAALVGSSAEGGDRWSDLDLTLSVAQDDAVDSVLGDWTEMVIGDLQGDVLFDLPYRSSIYRVFLLPDMLQVDLSFTPSSDFGPMGPRFRLLFGTATKPPEAASAPREETFGLAVHHAVRAYFCIKRDRLWQAEYWIHSLRDEALSLSCRSRGLPSSHGRGYDSLPNEVRRAWEETLPARLNSSELLRALGKATGLLLTEASELEALTARLRAQLEELLS